MYYFRLSETAKLICTHYIFVRHLQAHLLKKIDVSEETFDKKKDKWQKKISQLESALEKTKDSLHEEKARCRHKLTKEELRRNKVEEEIHDLNKWILEVDEKSKEAQ